MFFGQKRRKKDMKAHHHGVATGSSRQDFAQPQPWGLGQIFFIGRHIVVKKAFRAAPRTDTVAQQPLHRNSEKEKKGLRPSQQSSE